VGGFLAWAPAYVAVVIIAFRHQRLEIPIIAATSNVTWEFLWGFVFTQDMGPGLQFVYRGACIMDLFILFNVFRYGAKQTNSPLLRQYHVPLVLVQLVGWGFFFWSLRDSGYDLPLGSVSAYLDNIVMSSLYLWLLLSRPDPRDLSLTVALSKGIGTGMVTVFVFMRYPDNSFVRTLAVMVGLLDLTYIISLPLRLRQVRGRPPITSWSMLEPAFTPPLTPGG
jgi:ribose/xylose/arabinose/galactoside ABC-type transport system permease subunit